MGKLQNRQKPGHRAPGTRSLLLACPECWLGAAVAGQRWGIGVLLGVPGCCHCLELSIQQERRGRLQLLCMARKTGPLIPEGSDLLVFPAVRNLDLVRIIRMALCRMVMCALFEGCGPFMLPVLLESRENATRGTTVHLPPPAASPEILPCTRRAARLLPHGWKAPNLRSNPRLLLAP